MQRVFYCHGPGTAAASRQQRSGNATGGLCKRGTSSGLRARVAPFFSPELNKKSSQHASCVQSSSPSQARPCCRSCFPILPIVVCGPWDLFHLSLAAFGTKVAFAAVRMRTPNVMLLKGASYLRRPQSVYRLKDAVRYGAPFFPNTLSFN